MKLPDILIIISLVLVVSLTLTWIIPAGEFDRTLRDGRQIIVADSYKLLPASPQGIGALLTAPIKGFIDSSQIIGFVLIIGGAFGVVTKTGAIEAGLQRVINFSFKNRYYKKAIIPFLMLLFSMAGASFGMSEEILLFILITVPFSIAIGYDAIVGVSIPLIGTGAGFAGAVTNPFTIGIAQGIAELPIFSGWEYRLIVWLVLTAASILYVMYYAHRLEKKKGTRNDTTTTALNSGLITESLDLTKSRKVVLVFFLTAIVMLLVGVSKWGWYINEITGLFLALAILTATVYRIKSSEAVLSFVTGAKEMMTAVLVIAMAKGILIIATEGKIIDTILFHLSNAVYGFHPAVSAQCMFVVQNILNFFVPSGSGQAALTMPVMSPLSDLVGISRQTCVLIFQLGDGIGNMIIPTSGVTMGALAAAKIPYERWVRWAWPLIALLFILSALLLIPPVIMFNYK